MTVTLIAPSLGAVDVPNGDAIQVNWIPETGAAGGVVLSTITLFNGITPTPVVIAGVPQAGWFRSSFFNGVELEIYFRPDPTWDPGLIPYDSVLVGVDEYDEFFVPTPLTDTTDVTFTVASITITTTSIFDGTVGSPYEGFIFADYEVGGFAWSLDSGTLPPGLTLDTASTDEFTTLAGTPTTAGTYVFTVRVDDTGNAEFDTQEFTVVIAGLEIATTTLPSGTRGSSYGSQSIVAIRATTPTVWSLASGTLPPGLVLDTSSVTATTTLSGTPTTAGTYTFTVQVDDDSGQTDTQTYVVDIYASTLILVSQSIPANTLDVPVDFPMTMVFRADAAIDTDSFIVQRVGAIGYDIEGTTHPGYDVTYTFDVNPSFPSVANSQLTVEWIRTGGWLPSANYGAGMGTPDLAYTFYFIEALPAGGPFLNEYGTMQFTTASAAAAIEITTLSLPNGRTGSAYSADITATGGSGAGYMWAVTVGSLPPGLTLGASGTPTTVLSGIPTTAGSYNFTVEVTDDSTNTDTQDYTIVIGLAPPPPSGLRAGLDGGATMLLTSTYGAYGDATASWSAGSAAPTWLATPWRRTPGGLVVSLASTAVSVLNTGALAGDLRCRVLRAGATDDAEFGLTATASGIAITVGIRGDTVVLERDTGTRRVLGSAPWPGAPAELRLVLGNSQVWAYVGTTLVGRAAAWTADDTTTFGPVVRSRGGSAGGVLGWVAHNAALVFGGGPTAALGAVQSNVPVTGYGIEFVAPYRALAAVTDPTVTLAGAFGEVSNAEGMTWLLPRGAPRGNGIARLRRTTRAVTAGA